MSAPVYVNRSLEIAFLTYSKRQAASDPSMLAHAATQDPVGMRSFITARERAIDRISEEIREEEVCVVECNEAISDLALAIDEGKRTLIQGPRRDSC
jgi:transcription antitermination factor NusA-like protein